MGISIAVLGAGPGGYVAALRAAQGGAEVTVIEKENAGGTCLNRGCIPSKIMKTSADLLEKINGCEEFGISFKGSVAPDMEKLMVRKNRVIETQRKGIEGLFKHHGITYLKGEGTIQRHGLCRVRKEDGSVEEVAWNKLIVATGSEPLDLPPFPFDGRIVVSSNEVLNLDHVPPSVAIIGGGVIGCEFASILNALGATVTLVEARERILPIPSVDEGCSKTLLREMKKRKIKVLLNRTITGLDTSKEPAFFTIGPSPFAGGPNAREIPPLAAQADMIVLCTGRKPNTSGTGLKRVGVQTDPNGWIMVDNKMRTTNRDIFAIGDVTGPERIMLAHVAWAEGAIAAQNALGGNRDMDYAAVPAGIFTMPEVGCTGHTERSAKAAGLNIKSDTVLFRIMGKAQVMGEIAGEAKIISEVSTGRIVGVHIIGPHATDLIAEGTLAVKKGLTVEELAETIHAHPTLSEVLAEAAMKAAGQALHVY